MIVALLLASWLPTQTWSWAPVADAAKYRVYWSDIPIAWCTVDRLEFPASVCTATDCQGDIPLPPFTVAYITVTAVDASGNESSAEHGPVLECL